MKQVDWVEGTIEAHKSSLFVLPPIDGWILISPWRTPMPEYEKGIEDAKKNLNRLSKQFGEAQIFGTHRVSSSAFWMKSVKGKTERFYSVADGNIFMEGKPTTIEEQWELIDPKSKEIKNDKYWDRAVYTDAEHVLIVAKDWSINPMELEDRNDIGDFGYIGEMKYK